MLLWKMPIQACIQSIINLPICQPIIENNKPPVIPIKENQAKTLNKIKINT